jgi:hypothetical protein
VRIIRLIYFSFRLSFCLSFCLPFCLSFWALYPASAFAWGKTGHQLVCSVAETQLDATSRQWLKTTLALGEFLDGNGSDNFADACLWADVAKYSSHRDSYEQHFINIPAGIETIDLARDCAAMDCLTVGIRRSLVYLSQDSHGKREAARKAAALRYLGHLVGDLHQPLHVSHGEDWGGNKIKISGFEEPTNLHSLWDVMLVNQAGLTYPASINRLKPTAHATDSVQIMPRLLHSFELARTTAYRHTNGRPIASGDGLNAAYITRALPVIEGQLTSAADHLARLLTQIANGRLTVDTIDTLVFKP